MNWGGNLYLINGAMTKLQDAGEFIRSESKETETKEDDIDGENNKQSEGNTSLVELG